MLRRYPERTRTHRPSVRCTILLGLCCSFLLTCSNIALAQAGSPVIARVGTQEITAAELENEFRRASVPPEQRSDEVTSRILGDLVKRKYLVQRAIAVGLDRKPIIQSEIVRAREQVLATAYLQNKLAAHPDIGPREVDEFMTAHPLQFGKRAILTTDQIAIALNGDTSSVTNSVKNLHSLEEIDHKLSELGILHTRSPGILDSGDVPEAFFNAARTKKEDVVFVRAATKGIFLKAISETPLPLTGKDAENLARRMMLSRLLQDETNAPPASDIEIKYEGDYARLMARGQPDMAQPENKPVPEDKSHLDDNK
jgi:peptidyl-prolyl cis-trans isomerase C